MWSEQKLSYLDEVYVSILLLFVEVEFLHQRPYSADM